DRPEQDAQGGEGGRTGKETEEEAGPAHVRDVDAEGEDGEQQVERPADSGEEEREPDETERQLLHRDGLGEQRLERPRELLLAQAPRQARRGCRENAREDDAGRRAGGVARSA